MPNNNQQGGAHGRSDQGRHDERNQRNQRPQPAHRGEQQQDQRTAGGRSEAYAQQRDGEQMRAGYDRQDWDRQQPTHNVRSEPHWDPSSSPGSWDPAGSHAGTHGNWEDDRYHGSPSYGDEQERLRSSREQSGGNRARGWQEDSRYRSQGQPQGLGSRDINNRNVGGYGASDFRGERGFDSDRNYGERGASGFGVYGSRHDIRSGQDDYRGQGFGGERPHHDESLGHQLADAGRKLVGKVKRLVRNPKNYTRSDERIREDVCDRLSLSSEVDPSEVEVMVSNGEVTLTGTVQDRQMKFKTEELADDVAGVHEVHNQLRVRREQPGAKAQGITPAETQHKPSTGRS